MFSWVPFLGGKRICFGKTLADVNSRTLISYWSQYFDFEFAEPHKYKDIYPQNQVPQ